jgi:hypothetical protein
VFFPFEKKLTHQNQQLSTHHSNCLPSMNLPDKLDFKYDPPPPPEPPHRLILVKVKMFADQTDKYFLQVY